MARPLPFLIALFALFASTQVWAACSDEIALLEQRLQQLQSRTEESGARQGASDETEVQVKKGNAEVEIEAEKGGAEPDENWFGSPPSPGSAREQVNNARSMAKDGDEPGCMGHVEQARAILDQIDG